MNYYQRINKNYEYFTTEIFEIYGKIADDINLQHSYNYDWCILEENDYVYINYQQFFEEVLIQININKDKKNAFFVLNNLMELSIYLLNYIQSHVGKLKIEQNELDKFTLNNLKDNTNLNSICGKLIEACRNSKYAKINEREKIMKSLAIEVLTIFKIMDARRAIGKEMFK